MQENFTGPNPIHLYVVVRPNATNGVSKEFTARIGTCKTETEISSLIVADLEAMNDTFGGMMETVSTKGRSYRAFKATWTELDLTK